MSDHEDGVPCLECEARAAIARVVLDRANEVLGDLAHEMAGEREHGWQFAYAFANSFVNQVHDKFDAFVNDDIMQTWLARGKTRAKPRTRKAA